MLCPDDQTIIAQCTPRGSGAIALLRISGVNAIEIAQKISQLASAKELIKEPSHTIHYGSIINPFASIEREARVERSPFGLSGLHRPERGEIIDKAMILLMRGPKTFTGQDTVEITCHNNQFIIEQIIHCAILAGARLAQEGEFTKRAVLNGKIDLVQAEAINELIHAQTQIALKQSLSQLTGSFSQLLTNLEKDLLKALALSEASFEFLDEEMEFAPQIQHIIASVQEAIVAIKKTFNQQQQIRQGIRIAIIGSVNAGKSSLFNALLNQDRAIVNAIAGTTRDSIEAGLYKNGNYWTLVDTAGLRQTDDIIEQEGIRRSFEEAQKADIILLASDSSRSMTDEENKVYTQIQEQYPNKIILIGTKADYLEAPTLRSSHPSSSYGGQAGRLLLSLPKDQGERGEKLTCDVMPNSNSRSARGELVEPFERNIISVSSKNKQNIDMLEQLIENKIATLFAGIESPFLLNQRQHNLLVALENKLVEIILMLNAQPVAYELLSIHLNDAIAHLAELSGKQISEAGMDAIFREFCIGK